ncbi:MAG: RdgB/HAM1 family non-canonical purine NTP pyrophosphatase [Candidatus Aminicenantes bacterium]|nr:RdgB/HAM1 family non-canonical purine NTP pyrophosphatase [Candidatus Aminicenantes bacterium]
MIETPLLVATTNQGKKREIEAELSDLPIRIFSLADLKIFEDFPETGETFLDNAKGKSLFYSQKWEGLTLGEDSGLEIFSLNNAPGVFSARFSDPDATDEKNNDKVLTLLEQVPDKKRTARFVSFMVLSQKEKVIIELEGWVEGMMARERRGENGFGYDPLFFYPPLNRTFGQLSDKEKNKVSHRGRALIKLKTFLKDYLGISPC